MDFRADSHSLELERRLTDIVMDDPVRVEVLSAVHELSLPQSFVAAGFVRNAVWDKLHGYAKPTPLNDIDVIFFDRRVDRNHEIEITHQLTRRIPQQLFAVKNQARMHIRNNDPPYVSAVDGMANWPERCTAVGTALTSDRSLKIAAPFGLRDLFDLVVQPTRPNLASLVASRASEREWLATWPRLMFRDALQ